MITKVPKLVPGLYVLLKKSIAAKEEYRGLMDFAMNFGEAPFTLISEEEHFLPYPILKKQLLFPSLKIPPEKISELTETLTLKDADLESLPKDLSQHARQKFALIHGILLKKPLILVNILEQFSIIDRQRILHLLKTAAKEQVIIIVTDDENILNSSLVDVL